jgi:hypothetical protein
MHPTTPEAKRSTLSRVTEEINEQYRQALRLGQEAFTASSASIQAAINCGAALIRLKEAVGHGNFIAVISRECPDISIATAERWMRGARWCQSNKGLARNLRECKTLTALYRMVGILPDPEPKQPQQFSGEVKVIEEFCKRIQRRLKSVSELLQDAGIEDLPDDRRTSLKAELEPLVSLYKSL